MDRKWKMNEYVRINNDNLIDLSYYQYFIINNIIIYIISLIYRNKYITHNNIIIFIIYYNNTYNYKLYIITIYNFSYIT